MSIFTGIYIHEHICLLLCQNKILPSIRVLEMIRVCQQGKESDVTASRITQEVAEGRGVTTHQGAQVSTALIKRKEELGARVS